jgi:hypothetical protein
MYDVTALEPTLCYCSLSPIRRARAHTHTHTHTNTHTHTHTHTRTYTHTPYSPSKGVVADMNAVRAAAWRALAASRDLPLNEGRLRHPELHAMPPEVAAVRMLRWADSLKDGRWGAVCFLLPSLPRRRGPHITLPGRHPPTGRGVRPAHAGMGFSASVGRFSALMSLLSGLGSFRARRCGRGTACTMAMALQCRAVEGYVPDHSGPILTAAADAPAGLDPSPPGAG